MGEEICLAVVAARQWHLLAEKDDTSSRPW
jgi:hypothetical protein